MNLLRTSTGGWEETGADLRNKRHPLQHFFLKEQTIQICILVNYRRKTNQLTKQTPLNLFVYLFNANQVL